MIAIENISVNGWEAAIRGMRNPMNSWEKSDSVSYGIQFADTMEDLELAKMCDYRVPGIGPNDMKLMRQLYKAGTEHRKYLRMIHVQLDIVAPFYWWKEFDTYKIATVSNSCSTMHKLTAKPFEVDDFSHDKLDQEGLCILKYIVMHLNQSRGFYLDAKKEGDEKWAKHYWWEMIQLLPSSYNQRRTIDLSYETVINMIHQRGGHKLDEWRQLVEKLKTLPYIAEITEEG